MESTLMELDFATELTGAERTNLAALDALESWARHEAADLAVLSRDGGDGSLLAKAAKLAPELPAERDLVSTVFSHYQDAGDGPVLVAGIRFSSREEPQEAAVYVPLAMLLNEGCQPVDEDVVSIAEAVTIGSLVMGKIRWANLRRLLLTPDCADIRLPSPAPLGA